MESSGFGSQLLSVMEVLAKAAVAEIHRSVDDSCAVLRLEVSRSRRDIDLLKRKCDGMEAELRRTRRRARRRGLYPPAAERCPPGGSGLDRESSSWAAEALQAQQVDPDHEAELFLIKEEFAEEEKRLSGAEQSPCFNGFAERYLSPGVGPAFLPDGYAEDGAELGVKREEEEEDEEDEEEELDEEELDEEELDEEGLDEEGLDEEGLEEEEPDEDAAPLLDSTEAVDRPPWSPSDPRGGGGDAVEPSFPRGERQSEPPPFGFPPRPEDAAAPQAHALGRSRAAAARARRRARALLGCRRPPPPDAGHGAPPRVNAAVRAPPPQPTQLHYRNPNEENPAAAAASSFLVRGGGGGGGGLFGGGGVFGLARRMRTPWRSGVGEKRFNCTFCDKGFARFSQLKEHLRSHTGEKPFSCLQCGRSFTKQCNLIRHAVVHSGEKPYACALCGKCFTQRSSLKSHQKTAH